MQKPLVSIIIPACNEGSNAFNTIKSILLNTNFDDTPYEIIIINDGSTDGYDYDSLIGTLGVGLDRIRVMNTHGMGLAFVKNFGAAESRGDYILFLDSHMDVHTDWLYDMITTADNNQESLITAAIYDQSNPLSIGYGFVFNSLDLGMEWLPKKQNIPYEVPMAGGALMMFKRRFFNKIEGFDSGMLKWGREDSEISMRSWMFGYSVIINPKVEVGHIFRKSFPYKIGDNAVYRNILRFAFVHFNSIRLNKVIEYLRAYPEFNDFYTSKNIKESIRRRRYVDILRRFDDDWFFDKFNIHI